MISLNDEALYIVKRKAGNTYFAFTLGPDMKLVLAFFFFFLLQRRIQVLVIFTRFFFYLDIKLKTK